MSSDVRNRVYSPPSSTFQKALIARGKIVDRAAVPERVARAIIIHAGNCILNNRLGIEINTIKRFRFVGKEDGIQPSTPPWLENHHGP